MCVEWRLFLVRKAVIGVSSGGVAYASSAVGSVLRFVVTNWLREKVRMREFVLHCDIL